MFLFVNFVSFLRRSNGNESKQSRSWHHDSKESRIGIERDGERSSRGLKALNWKQLGYFWNRWWLQVRFATNEQLLSLVLLGRAAIFIFRSRAILSRLVAREINCETGKIGKRDVIKFSGTMSINTNDGNYNKINSRTEYHKQH